MNHLNFNKDLDLELDRITKHPELDADGFAMHSDVLTAPIFVWEGPPSESPRIEESHRLEVVRGLANNPDMLPFRMLRIHAPSPAEIAKKGGLQCANLWVWHYQGALRLRISLRTLVPKVLMMHINTNRDSLEVDILLRVGSVFVDHDRLDQSEDTDNLLEFVSFLLTAFITEVSSPSGFIAAVSPDKKGKSVEWMRARTHYVLIHKKHPANNPSVKKGQSVVEDEASIKRQAHTRRAHDRILRSPRFRNKVGQRIRVKSCWVGPEEWKQFGSIYKIVEPRTGNA